jgi:hypothetical protein
MLTTVTPSRVAPKSSQSAGLPLMDISTDFELGVIASPSRRT